MCMRFPFESLFDIVWLFWRSLLSVWFGNITSASRRYRLEFYLKITSPFTIMSYHRYFVSSIAKVRIHLNAESNRRINGEIIVWTSLNDTMMVKPVLRYVYLALNILPSLYAAYVKSSCGNTPLTDHGK